MKLIVGIGNFGREYDKTRHNVGFMIIDNYLGKIKYQEKFEALYKKMDINGETIYFIKPLTYVNNSGIAVRKYVKYFNIGIDDILVIQDDLDEPIGKYKLKKHSSSGGHNGIKSIIEMLGTEEFPRIRIGIGKPQYKDNKIDYVIGSIPESEMLKLQEGIENAKNGVLEILKNGIDTAMNKFN